jgi:gamma-D-glutamyl-L-lysine dipeptidyl-peptidase
MPYAICHISNAPIRKDKSDTSEIITQILFGETVEILDTHQQWRYVRCTWDDYEGWLDHKQIIACEQDFVATDTNMACPIALTGIAEAADHRQPILIGSSLPYFDGNAFKIGTKNYRFTEKILFPAKIVADGNLISNLAHRYLHAPYLWGGRSPFGIDCSGFTQVVFKMAGISLPRDAWQQAEKGQQIPLKTAKKGDLAFFVNDKGRIIHVGILISATQIIHAAGYVRIDNLDEKGIFNVHTQQYSHTFFSVRRYLFA